MRAVTGEIRRLQSLPPEELMTAAKELKAPYELVVDIARTGRLPVVNFAAGGVATPADAALMMQLGADPPARARAIVAATTHYNDPEILARFSGGLGTAMKGLEIASIPAAERMQERGW